MFVLPRILLVLLVLPALSGCFTLTNLMTPSEGYRHSGPVRYGALDRQDLDIYTPSDRNKPAPVAVFFYGGGWMTGHRDDYRFLAQALTQSGYVVVIPNYRLYPQAFIPDMINDAAASVHWVRKFISRYGGDADRIVLMGHSAGAHLAAMLVYDKHYLNEKTAGTASHSPDWLKAWVGLSGAYDLNTKESDFYRRFVGETDKPENYRPMDYVQGNEAPALLLHGLDDGMVPTSHSSLMAEAVRNKGGAVTLKFYEDLGHMGVVGALAKPFRHWAPVLQDIAGFLKPALQH